MSGIQPPSHNNNDKSPTSTPPSDTDLKTNKYATQYFSIFRFIGGFLTSIITRISHLFTQSPKTLVVLTKEKDIEELIQKQTIEQCGPLDEMPEMQESNFEQTVEIWGSRLEVTCGFVGANTTMAQVIGAHSIQEDQCFSLEVPLGKTSCHIFGVADGHGVDEGGEHGGDRASLFIAQRFHLALVSRLRNVNIDKLTLKQVQHIAKEVLTNLQKQFIKDNPDCVEVGTTIAANILLGDRLFSINVGDSRSIKVGSSETQQLTADASADDPNVGPLLVQAGAIARCMHALDLLRAKRNSDLPDELENFSDSLKMDQNRKPPIYCDQKTIKKLLHDMDEKIEKCKDSLPAEKKQQFDDELRPLRELIERGQCKDYPKDYIVVYNSVRQKYEFSTNPGVNINYVSASPSDFGIRTVPMVIGVTETRVQKGDMIIVGSDGVFAFCSTQFIGQMVQKIKDETPGISQEELTKKLMEMAVKKALNATDSRYVDNTSIVIKVV